MFTETDMLNDYRRELGLQYSREEIDRIFSTLDEKLRDIVSEKEKENFFRSSLNRLRSGEPYQYVVGEAWFLNMRFLVNRHVLIPRPETEELVEWIMVNEKSPASILDACTGSGCIAVALKKFFPEAHVTATDTSTEALDIAGRNSILNQSSVAFLIDDILQPTAFGSDARFDLVVSNPPYIGRNEMEKLAPSVRDFEPGAALFVPGNDPLVFYKALAEFGMRHLVEKGSLYLEINQEFGEEVCAILEERGYEEVVLKKDMSGNDRMVKARIKSTSRH